MPYLKHFVYQSLYFKAANIWLPATQKICPTMAFVFGVIQETGDTVALVDINTLPRLGSRRKFYLWTQQTPSCQRQGVIQRSASRNQSSQQAGTAKWTTRRSCIRPPLSRGETHPTQHSSCHHQLPYQTYLKISHLSYFAIQISYK